MAREFARRVGPRGPGPDFGGREVEKPRVFNTPVPQHTPGPHCGECKPRPCSKPGCDGFAHRLGLDWGRQCGTCGKRQV